MCVNSYLDGKVLCPRGRDAILENPIGSERGIEIESSEGDDHHKAPKAKFKGIYHNKWNSDFRSFTINTSNCAVKLFGKNSNTN